MYRLEFQIYMFISLIRYREENNNQNMKHKLIILLDDLRHHQSAIQ